MLELGGYEFFETKLDLKPVKAALSGAGDHIALVKKAHVMAVQLSQYHHGSWPEALSVTYHRSSMNDTGQGWPASQLF